MTDSISNEKPDYVVDMLVQYVQLPDVQFHTIDEYLAYYNNQVDSVSSNNENNRKETP